MTEVVITGAARTPVGAFLGGLSRFPHIILAKWPSKPRLNALA